jgi:hypothetical protein
VIDVDAALRCDCFFCESGRQHPDSKYHREFAEITSVLLVAESLRPEDRIRMEACMTCGHKRRKEVM